MNLLKEETLAKKLITKGSLAYIFAFLIAPVWYLVRVIISNTLTVEDVGIFYSIIWLISILAAYNDLWLTEALQYFLPKYWIEKKYNEYKTIWIVTFFMQILSWILIWSLLWLWADWLWVHYFHAVQSVHILRIFSIYFIAINFLQAFASVYIAFQDVIYDKIVETVRMYSILIFTVVFWLMQSISLENFSYAWLGGLSVWLVLSIFLFIKKYSYTLQLGNFSFDKNIIKKQFSYAFWVFLWLNAGILLWQVDQQMIVVLLGPESAWYYSNYLSLFTLYGIFAFPIMGLLFPIMTELLTKRQTEKINTLLSLLYKYFTLFGLAIWWFLFSFWPIISSVLYWSNFTYSWFLLRYAAWFIVFNILLSINFSIMAGMGKVKERVFILALALSVNVVLNILFIVVFNRALVWAIVATIIWWIIMFALTFILVYSNYKIRIDRIFFIKNSIVIIILNRLMSYRIPYYDRGSSVSFFIHVWHIVLIALSYIFILMLCNYKSIKMLVSEVRNIITLK